MRFPTRWQKTCSSDVHPETSFKCSKCLAVSGRWSLFRRMAGSDRLHECSNDNCCTDIYVGSWLIGWSWMVSRETKKLTGCSTCQSSNVQSAVDTCTHPTLTMSIQSPNVFYSHTCTNITFLHTSFQCDSGQNSLGICVPEAGWLQPTTAPSPTGRLPVLLESSTWADSTSKHRETRKIKYLLESRSHKCNKRTKINWSVVNLDNP